MSRRARIAFVSAAIAIGAVLAAFYARRPAARVEPAPLVRATTDVTTSRADLDRAMTSAEQKLAANPADGRAAVAFAQAALRRARVESNGGYTLKAEKVLKAVLDREPADYDVLKMLGAVYMSQHRFREAIEIATRALAVNPNDAWNYGVLGDAHIELGEYPQAFDAFDTMARHRPDAAAYARISYAQELQGNLKGAIASMTMAAEATGAQDPESLAWHYAQIGNLLLQQGDVDGAEREFARADHAFPGHPFARRARRRSRPRAGSTTTR